MLYLRTWEVAIVFALAAACATSEPTRPAAHPGAPDLETQRAVFDLIKVTTICLKFNQPIQPGEVVLAGVFSEPGRSVQVFDSHSTPGNEHAIACTVEQAGRVKSPRSPPSVFVVYSIPLPIRAEDIRIYFPSAEPARKQH